MFQRLKNWLAAPIFPADEQKTRQAALVNPLILSLLAVMWFAAVGAFTIFPARSPTLIIVAANTVFLWSCKEQLHRGRVQQVNIVLIGGLWLLSTVLVALAGGASSVNMLDYVIVIVIAALLFGRRGAIIVSVSTMVMVLLMVIADLKGWMLPRLFPTPPVSGWMMLGFAMIVVVTTVSLAIDSRDQAIAQMKRAAQEREQVLKALSASEQKLQAIFNAAKNVSFIVTDVNGMKSRILEFSPGAEHIFGYRSDEIIGERVALLHLTSDVARFPEMFELMRQNQVGFDGEMTLVRKSGERFPALFTAYPLFDEKGELSAALGISVDLSELKKSQTRETTLSRGLRGVIMAADELLRCEDLDTLYRRAVELGRQRLGLERVGFYILDEARGIFVGTYGTDLEGHTTDEHQATMPITENERLLDSLWHVLHNTTSHWEGDQLIYTGQHWSVCTPIASSDRKLYGLLFNDAAISKAPLNEAQQETVAVYCSLLGSIIEQKRAQAGERELSHGLRAVVAAADELMACDDLEALYRRAVELGREKLGLERCALFLLDEAEKVLIGTFGTDLRGQTTDQRGARQPLEDYVLETGDSLYKVLHNTASHWENDHKITTTLHWSVATSIRSLARHLGIFFNDTAITHTPLNPAQQDAVAVYCSLLGNIIELKRADQALRQTSWIVENSPTVAYRREADPRRSLTFITENVRQWGYTAAELVRGGFDEIVHPADRKQALESASAYAPGGGNGAPRREYRLTTRDGQVRWVEDRSITEQDADGKITSFHGVITDITERKQAEAERERLIAQLETKNAELERFTYTVSHDLKAPLITIQGFLGYLEKDAEQGKIERLHADVNRISEAANRMQRLLNDLLELSRIGRIVNPPKRVPFELIVEEALRLVQGRLKQRKVEVVVADELPFVFGDSARLVEVVQNLVDNAAKFMGDQPSPRIEIGSGGKDPQGLNLFFVRDNGIGIAPQFRDRIFGLFDKLDPKTDGTGVGLALVKRIIEVHGGKIWVESEGEDRGSTFFFTLPDTPNSLSD